jgi:hypothetical protein
MSNNQKYRIILIILSIIGFILIFSIVGSAVVDVRMEEDGKEIIRQLTTSLIAIVSMLVGANQLKDK